MTARVFVDTNLLVYFRDAGAPRKQAIADEWLRRLWSERSGRTSMQVLSEYYVTVTRKLKRRLDAADAWDDVQGLLRWLPRPIDADLVIQARDVERRHRLNWWDCMIVAAAQLQSCSLLLSEDLQDGGDYGGVVVRNPFTLSVNESPGEYHVASSFPRHPPRGRPRRPTHGAT